MPKSAPRRKRIRAARSEADPTGLSARAEGGADAEAGATQSPAAVGKKGAAKKAKEGKVSKGDVKDKDLLPLLEKMQASASSDRLWSTSAVAHVLASSDANVRRALQAKNIVGLLIERLADEEVEVQVEACGALRNLAIEGSFEVCAEMFNKSIVQALAKQLEPLGNVVTSVLEGTPASSDAEKQVRKIVWTWTENLATLFWCLAETSDKAFRAVVGLPALSNLLYTVLRHAVPADGTESSKVPLSVALAAAQAVYVLTDANVPSAPKFPLPRDVSLSAALTNTRGMLMQSLRTLSEDAESSSPTKQSENSAMLQVVTVGILQNLSQQELHGKQMDPEEVDEFNQLALTSLTKSLTGVDLVVEAAKAAQAHRSLPASAGKVEIEGIAPSAQRTELDECEKRWTRLRLSLEILGEISAELDGIVDAGLLGDEVYEEWNGIKGSNSKQENGDMEEDDDMTDAANGIPGAGPSQKPISLSSEAISIFSSLPPLLLNLAQPTSISFATPAFSPISTFGDSSLLSTQVDGAPSNGTDNKKTYIPLFSDLLSLVHSRALECLNNLLITIGRSESGPALKEDAQSLEDAEPSMMEDDDDDAEAGEMEAEGDDDELPAEMGIGGEDDDSEEAAKDAVQAYLSNNRAMLQSMWEGLFRLLVSLMSTLQEQKKAPAQSSAGSAAKGKKKATGPVQEQDEAVPLSIEACLGCIWALTRLASNTLTVGRDESSLLISVLAAKDSGELDSDAAVRCIGALAQLAVRPSVTVDENKAIGQAIITRLSALQSGHFNAAEDGEYYAQLLDAIFDVYGDETRDYDRPVYIEGEFNKVLETILPTFRRLVKAVDRRKLPEARTRADAALLNLQEFIKYRKSLK